MVEILDVQPHAVPEIRAHCACLFVFRILLFRVTLLENNTSQRPTHAGESTANKEGKKSIGKAGM